MLLATSGRINRGVVMEGKWFAYLPDWPKNPVTLAQIPTGENVGLLLKHAGMVDVDMDSPEAQYTVPAFLDSKTLAVGRGGKNQALSVRGCYPESYLYKPYRGRTPRHPAQRQADYVGGLHSPRYR
jgi:hypothetical protein